ncbi:MAG: SPFH domain-containing protein [Chloroflexi bacterium]|nr:SPFH domain-containing protein [Chloroflexota bacterium]
MLGIQYIKVSPTNHIIHYQNGKAAHSGVGLAFFYYAPISSVAIVPVGSVDVPFIFNEMTADFQPITVQGQLTFRVNDAERVASLLNYTTTVNGAQYVSQDPDKLPQRVINITQVLTRSEVGARPMREAIRSSDAVAAAVMSKLKTSEELKSLGVEVLTLSILAIKPTPEMARALEAEAREELLRRADQAIYDRRNASVEQERRIKENELNTEIAVEEKQRQIREAKVEADLAVEAKEQQVREAKIKGQIKVEEDRKQLVSAQAENVRAEADAQSYTIEASLRPLRDLDANVLQMLAIQNTDPRIMVSLAMKELAQNASKIGNLNISPELLETLRKKSK